MKNQTMIMDLPDSQEAIEEALRENGYDPATIGEVIPLVCPIHSLDDIPVVLSNLNRHSASIAKQIKAELEGKPEEQSYSEELLSKNEELLSKNAELKKDVDRLTGELNDLRDTLKRVLGSVLGE